MKIFASAKRIIKKHHSQKAIGLLLTLFTLFTISCKPTELSTTNKFNEKEELKFKYTFHNAGKEKILGNYELAFGLFNQCIKIDPTQPAPYFELAQICHLAGKKEVALEYIAKAAKIDPNNEWYQLSYADLLEKNNQTEKAIPVYELLVKKSPNKPDYYYELANAYLNLNEIEKAIKTYDKLEDIFGLNEEIALQKQKLYMALNNNENAILEIEKLIKTNPNEVKYYIILAEIFLTQNKEIDAIRFYNKALEIDPGNAYISMSLSDFYYKKDEKAKAFTYLKKVFENASFEIDNKVKILLNYYVLTENDSILKKEAFELNEILINTHPTEAKSYSIYGDFLIREQKYTEAREQFRKALTFDKSKYAIWNEVMLLNAELNDYLSLERESNDALEYFPTQPNFYLYNGIANIHLKQFEKAIQNLETGALLVVDNKTLSSQFYANLGDLYNQIKKFTESDNAYDNSLSFDPENVIVLNNYSYYLSLRNTNLDKAEKMSKKSNELVPNNSNFQDTYAWILFKMGKFIEAKDWLERAMNNGGASNSSILEHYGDVLYKSNDKQKALEYWQKAKEKGKGSELLDKKINEQRLFE